MKYIFIWMIATVSILPSENLLCNFKQKKNSLQEEMTCKLYTHIPLFLHQVESIFKCSSLVLQRKLIKFTFIIIMLNN